MDMEGRSDSPHASITLHLCLPLLAFHHWISNIYNYLIYEFVKEGKAYSVL